LLYCSRKKEIFKKEKQVFPKKRNKNYPNFIGPSKRVDNINNSFRKKHNFHLKEKFFSKKNFRIQNKDRKIAKKKFSGNEEKVKKKIKLK